VWYEGLQRQSRHDYSITIFESAVTLQDQVRLSASEAHEMTSPECSGLEQLPIIVDSCAITCLIGRNLACRPTCNTGTHARILLQLTCTENVGRRGLPGERSQKFMQQ
jgi:hypothetical protein